MLIKYSALVSDTNGKLGGSIATRVRCGHVLKNSFTPSNPRKPMQANNRASFYYLTKRWQSLTDIQRAGWNALAAISTSYNRFGDPYRPTGQMLFIGYNQNLYLVSEAYIFDAPVAETFSEITGPSIGFIEQGVNLMRLNWPISPTGSNVAHMIYATDSISAGINYVLSQYRQIGVLPPGSVSNYDIYSMYITKFPAFIANQRIFIMLRPICIHTGIAGVSSFCNVKVHPHYYAAPIGLAVIGTDFAVS